MPQEGAGVAHCSTAPGAGGGGDEESATSDEDASTTADGEGDDHRGGPFFHGTRAVLDVGEHLVAGRTSNFHPGRVMNHVYFTDLIETAAWGAELAAALGGADARGYVYQVQPTGAFEDDPNVTDKKFPGNPTRSYRSRHPLRITGQLHHWPGHDRETLQAMLDGLRLLRESGRDLIED